MALPNLVRISFVAKLVGVHAKTARAGLLRAGCTPVRMPRASATDRDGPWYVTREDAVRLVDWLLPRAVHARANARARRCIADEARLMGRSGPLVRFRGNPGYPPGNTPTDPPLQPPTPKFPVQTSDASHHVLVSEADALLLP